MKTGQTFKRVTCDTCKGLTQDTLSNRKKFNAEQEADKKISDSIATVHQSNYQVFRMLFSPKSQTLSIHFINMNPYSLSVQNFKEIMGSQFNLLQDLILKPVSPSEAQEKLRCKCNEPQMGHKIAPVFLKRNLKLMQKHRG